MGSMEGVELPGLSEYGMENTEYYGRSGCEVGVRMTVLKIGLEVADWLNGSERVQKIKCGADFAGAHEYLSRKKLMGNNIEDEGDELQEGILLEETKPVVSGELEDWLIRVGEVFRSMLDNTCTRNVWVYFAIRICTSLALIIILRARDSISRNGILHYASANGHINLLKSIWKIFTSDVNIINDILIKDDTLQGPDKPDQLTVLLFQDNVWRIAVNSRNEYGNTPLHWAVTTRQINVVEWLINHGLVDLSIRNESNLTAQDVAIQTLRTIPVYDTSDGQSMSKFRELEAIVELFPSGEPGLSEDDAECNEWLKASSSSKENVK